MELRALRYEVTDAIATITLARPHRLNAWTGRMHEEYRWAVAQAEEDPDVGVIVLTGEGRGFCAGADAKALEGHVEKGRYDSGVRNPLARPGYGVHPSFDAAFAFHFGLTKPVIAAVNGPAAGVGMALACFCDLRLASTEAKFTTAHGKLNLPAEYGLSWLLPRQVGLTRAADLLLSSRIVPADEAERIGLVNSVHPPEELLPRTYDYASMLATSVAPGSLRASKHQLYVDLHRDIGASVAHAEGLLEEMMQEPAFAEGVAALTEKRPPRFR